MALRTEPSWSRRRAARSNSSSDAAALSSVASRYDLMNDLMSGGMHRLWKDRFVSRVKPRAGERILDMAGGTGDVAFRMARRGAHVTVADINAEMLEVGKDRAERRGIDGLDWREENAEALTFDDSSFDAYTIVFGIRNVTDIPAALREVFLRIDAMKPTKLKPAAPDLADWFWPFALTGLGCLALQTVGAFGFRFTPW